MPLSADQEALLELLTQKGQGYDDIGELLGASEDEVRARARAALTELGGADPDQNVALTDWVLGQADPIGRADAARHVREDPEDHRLAAGLIASLREIAPDGAYPKLPPEPKSGRLGRRGAPRAGARGAPPPPRSAAGTPGAPSPGRGLPALSSRQTRLAVIGGSGALLLIVVVLAVTGAFSGGEDSGASASATTSTTTGDEDIQTVELKPAGGGDAKGAATFGIASGQQAFVDLDVANLQPAPNGKAYILWLMVSADQGHPLSPFQVNQDGTYHEQIPIASFLTELASKTQSVTISLAPRGPLLKQVADAVDKGTPIIPFTGETILTGDIAPAGA